MLSARFSNAVSVNRVKLKKFNTSALNNNSENNISCVFKLNYLKIYFILNREIIISL